MKTTIVLADDHPVVREGVRALLEREPDFAVVGETGDGREAVELVDRLRPAVLLVDIMMPGLNGLEITRQVRHRNPETRVVVLSVHATQPHVLEALRNGASAYVVKGASAAELVHGVREAAAGRRYLSSPLSDPAIEAYLERAKTEPLDLYETLSTREREVLQLAAEGFGNTQIAARLGIGARTVETHRANAMRKLRLSSQTDLVRYALQRGLLPMEPSGPIA
jgi:DNA-binding NarL/FixJ family response regulator